MPPGRSTRLISRSATSGSRMQWSMLQHVRASKDSLSKGSSVAQPSRKSTVAGSRHRAIANICGVASMPAKVAPGRSRQSLESSTPVPQPTSSNRSPSRGPVPRRSIVSRVVASTCPPRVVTAGKACDSFSTERCTLGSLLRADAERNANTAVEASRATDYDRALAPCSSSSESLSVPTSANNHEES